MPKTVPVGELVRMSAPALDRFAQVEPKRWNRTAVLVELVGELGSLAHQVQQWEGFKPGRPHPAKLADECADVLLIIFRLAREDGVRLPAELDSPREGEQRPAEGLLKLLGNLAQACHAEGETMQPILCQMIRELAAVAEMLGVDLVEAHQREMEITMQYFAAAGGAWPRLRRFRHPVAAFRLWRLLRRKWKATIDKEK